MRKRARAAYCDCGCARRSSGSSPRLGIVLLVHVLLACLIQILAGRRAWALPEHVSGRRSREQERQAEGAGHRGRPISLAGESKRS